MACININFRKHMITVEREHASNDWYITVTAPSGAFTYDGWWRDSAYKPASEAIAEAKRGAMLTATTKGADHAR